MLTSFTITHRTDGDTKVVITVEPAKRQLSGYITIDSIITRQFTEDEPSFRSTTGQEWLDTDYWDRRAAELARAYSPFWRGLPPRPY